MVDSTSGATPMKFSRLPKRGIILGLSVPRVVAVSSGIVVFVIALFAGGANGALWVSPAWLLAAIAAWTEAAGITTGPLFRRVQVRRYKARAAVRGRPIDSISGRETWDLRKTLSKPAVKARVEYDIGTVALHPGSIGPIFRSIIQRAFDRGALPDLTTEDLARLLKGISAHSTRIGLNQDLFASGEDLAGIMDALRWKSPRMPLAYNRNLAAEAGAVGRLSRKLQ